jgi:hypothetical protein
MNICIFSAVECCITFYLLIFGMQQITVKIKSEYVFKNENVYSLTVKICNVKCYVGLLNGCKVE